MTIEEAVALLNEAIDIDARAIRRLFDTRATCSRELAEHPLIVVSDDNRIGLLGIINAFFADSGRRIVAHYDNGKIEYFDSKGASQ